MKLNIKNITALLLTSCMLLGTGCSKFLEQVDPSNVSPDSYYTIPEHAESAIAAVYAQMRFIGGGAGIFSNNFQLLDAPTGITNTETAQNSDLNNMYSLVYDGNNLHINQWWNGLYKTIGLTNLVLERVPGIPLMDPAQMKRVLGEAQFVRAWSYFYLVRLWGDVPLITKPQSATSTDFYPTRTAQEEVYKLIVDDLTAAEASGLGWTDQTRVPMAAIKSLLAKVYLTMAGFPLNKGAAYYKLAADKAKEVVDYSTANPTVIGLFPTYNDIHKVANNNKLEHIFEIQYKSDIAGNPLQSCMLPLHQPVSSIDGIGTTVPTQAFYASYEAGDLRAKNREGYFFTDYWKNGSEPDLYTPGNVYIFKHFDFIANGTLGVPGTNQSNLNLPLIRYAEVLLIYAEAQNEATGNPDAGAYNALKSIRDRAQLITPAIGTFNQTSFREAVWKERWHELCYEGILWFDMLRLKKVYNETTKGFDNFVGHVNRNSNQALEDKHLLFPLPVNEMRNNPNLKPNNPGYL
jgi:hypothetical protein